MNRKEAGRFLKKATVTAHKQKARKRLIRRIPGVDYDLSNPFGPGILCDPRDRT